jgi:hypothetical protein
MLQLNHSQATNTNAVYPDVLAPAGTTQVLLDFTQSINKNTTPNVIATLANTVSATNPWLVIQLTGSSVPTASGQYDVDIYTFTQAGTLGTWGSTSNFMGMLPIILGVELEVLLKEFYYQLKEHMYRGVMSIVLYNINYPLTEVIITLTIIHNE